MLERIGHFLFRFRNAMFPLVAAPLLLPGPEIFDETLTAAVFGFLVAALGQSVRVLTIGLRYVIRGGRNRRVYAEDLVTDGLYSHSRNPMYIGNVLIVVGVGLGSYSLSALLVGTALAIFMYSCIVAAEEGYLFSRFGEGYVAYAREVPRWLPRLPGLRATLSQSQFRWARVLVKEYGTPFGWVNILAVVTLYEIWSDGEWQVHHAAVHAVLCIISAVTGAWLLAWGLKRSRTIQAD